MHRIFTVSGQHCSLVLLRTLSLGLVHSVEIRLCTNIRAGPVPHPPPQLRGVTEHALGCALIEHESVRPESFLTVHAAQFRERFLVRDGPKRRE